LDQATNQEKQKPPPKPQTPKCSCCDKPMIKVGSFPPQTTPPKLFTAVSISAASTHPPPD